MNFLEKVRKISEGEKKIILWSLMLLAAAGLVVLYAKNAQKRMSNFDSAGFKKSFNFPGLEEEFKKIPEIQLPDMGFEDVGGEISGTSTASTSEEILLELGKALKEENAEE